MPLCSSCGGNTFIPRVTGDKFQTSFQPEQVASVRRNIELDLEDYEAEICRLLKEKECLERYAAQLQSLDSPFHKIPNEILRQILDDSCDMNSFRAFDLKSRHPTPDAQAVRSKPAMVVSSVCSRWRQNALSTPVIWSRISLYWEFQEDDNWDGQEGDSWENEDTGIFALLSHFLDRSQRNPMTLNLDLVANALTDESALHPLLKQFFGRIVHWQCLSFYCEDYGIGVLLDRAGIPSVSFPVLRKLRMLGSAFNRDLNRDLIPFINTAPNLQMLNLPGRFVISRRNIENHNRIDIQDIFDRFPNLFSLGLTESLLYGDVVAPTPIAYSSKLEILTVGHHDEWEDSYDSPNPVFPILRLPSLKVLHLVYDKPGSGPTDNHGVYFEDNLLDDSDDSDAEETRWSSWGPFRAFVLQSSFQLTTFSIQRLSISDVNLVEILVLLPTLQDFTVDDYGISPIRSPISSEFVDSLHAHRTSPLLLHGARIIPRLRSLRLLNLATLVFKDLSVVEMIQSRWSPAQLHTVGTSAFEVDCLRVFTMTFLYRSEVEASGVYRSLEPIEQNGMMVVIQMSGKTLWL